jgi:hypothetical protein
MERRVIPSARHVRCTLCGTILPAWLPHANAPECAMLLHHLGTWHLAEAKPYLQRMETEDIEAVVMEAFERLEDFEATVWLIARMHPEALRAAIDAALVPDDGGRRRGDGGVRAG